MKRLHGLTLMLSLALASSGASAQSAPVTGPDTVVFNGSRGAVTFTHRKHSEYGECVSCHHESKPEKPTTEPYEKCTACHTTPAVEPMRTSLRNAYHDTAKKTGLCYDCHTEEAAKGTVVPVACAECHIRGN